MSGGIHRTSVSVRAGGSHQPLRGVTANSGVTFVHPCLNEAKAVSFCVTEAWSAASIAAFETEVILADNGSSDQPAELAASLGARVVQEWKTYDALGRAILQKSCRFTAAAPGTSSPLSEWNPIRFDRFGHLLHQIETRYNAGAGFAQNIRTISNTYDGLHRLTSEVILLGAAATPDSKTVNTYDHANNRTRMVRTGTGAETVDYYYDPASPGAPAPPTAVSGENPNYSPNQLVAFVRSGSTQNATVRFRYDLRGNRTRRIEGTSNITTTTYQWDRANRLCEIQKDIRKWSYAYDHRTRRIGRTVQDNATYLAQERDAFAGGTAISRWNVSGPAPALTSRFIRGSDFGGGVGGLLYTVDPAGNPDFLEYGLRGDVTGTLDKLGAASFRANYRAFGDHADQGTAPAAIRQRASTKEEESELGLLNEGFRYRDIETGIFLSRDPAGFVDGPNVYTYVVQNPWSAFDVLGLVDKRTLVKILSSVVRPTECKINVASFH